MASYGSNTRSKVEVGLIVLDLSRSCLSRLVIRLMRQEAIAILESIGHKFTDGSQVGIADLVAENELWPVNFERQKKVDALTKNDSERVRTSSFVKYPSLFLSCKLKNHSIFSIRSLNITPSRPDTRSWNVFMSKFTLRFIPKTYLERQRAFAGLVPEIKETDYQLVFCNFTVDALLYSRQGQRSRYKTQDYLEAIDHNLFIPCPGQDFTKENPESL